MLTQREDDMTNNNEIYDKNYWENKSEVALKISEKLHELLNEISEIPGLVFNKGRISISCEGYNWMAIHRRTGEKALIVFSAYTGNILPPIPETFCHLFW